MSKLLMAKSKKPRLNAEQPPPEKEREADLKGNRQMVAIDPEIHRMLVAIKGADMQKGKKFEIQKFVNEILKIPVLREYRDRGLHNSEG